MPTTAKTLRALRAALKEAHDQADLERQRVLIAERGLAPGEYARLLGKVEGLSVARRLVEGMCQ